MFSALRAEDADQVAAFARALNVTEEMSADEEAAEAVERGEMREPETRVQEQQTQVTLHNVTVTWEDVARRFL